MYEPPLHRVEDLAELHALIRARVFGLLISNGAEGLVANSVPFVLDSEASRLGTLKVHVARANHQWRDLQEQPDALVVFQGHDHYITPSWYETKRETGKVVPTWNYTMVQVKGRAKVMDDAWLARQIEALTNGQEAGCEMGCGDGNAMVIEGCSGFRGPGREVIQAPRPILSLRIRGPSPGKERDPQRECER